MNSKITLQQAIQQRQDILVSIYDVQDRDNNKLNISLWMHCLREWDTEILEHLEYRYLNNLEGVK